MILVKKAWRQDRRTLHPAHPPSGSTASMAARLSCSPASCPSSEPLRHLSPEWAPWLTASGYGGEGGRAYSSRCGRERGGADWAPWLTASGCKQGAGMDSERDGSGSGYSVGIRERVWTVHRMPVAVATQHLGIIKVSRAPRLLYIQDGRGRQGYTGSFGPRYHCSL